MQPSYTARDHLLGRLAPEAQDAADDRILTDSAYYRELTREEELLVEEFAEGRLSATDAEAFRRLCLRDPRLSERVSLERELPALLRSTGNAAVVPIRPPAAVPNRFKAMFAVAAGIAVMATGTAAYFGLRLSTERTAFDARRQQWERQASGERALIAGLQQNQAFGTPKPELIHPTSRGVARIAPIPVSVGAAWINLGFTIGTDMPFDSYRVVIEDRDAPVVNVRAPWTSAGNYRIVSIMVPATLPKDRNLQASVAGITPGMPDRELETYTFRLTEASGKPPAR